MARKTRYTTLFLSEQDARLVLGLTFGKNTVPKDLIDEDKQFAQHVLIKLIDGSAAMGWIETAFRSAYPLPSSVQSLIKRFVRNTLSQSAKWYRQSKTDELQDLLDNAVIYQAVMNAVRLSHRTHWQTRLSLGHYVGY